MYGYDLSPLEINLLFHFYTDREITFVNDATALQHLASRELLAASQGHTQNRLTLPVEVGDIFDRAIMLYTERYRQSTNIVVGRGGASLTLETFTRSIQSVHPIMSGNTVYRTTAGKILYGIEEERNKAGYPTLFDVVDTRSPIQWSWLNARAAKTVLGFAIALNPALKDTASIEADVSDLLFARLDAHREEFHTTRHTLANDEGLKFTYTSDYAGFGYPLVVSVDLDTDVLFDHDLDLETDPKNDFAREFLEHYSSTELSRPEAAFVYKPSDCSKMCEDRRTKAIFR